MMNIGIIGLGLIGGCLGLDLRQRGYKILGLSRQIHTCERAIALGIADEASVELSLLKNADLVIICTPLHAMTRTMTQIIPYLKPDVIVTDVGSVKQPIVEQLSSLWPNFVGSHPMAGKAESGIEATELDLFQGRPYVITPIAQTPQRCIEKVAEIAEAIGSQIYYCSPAQHDQAVAWISHLPVMVSASLINACMQESNQDVLKLAKNLASSGFRDTSRVGGGSPELGLMMAQYNRTEVLRSLGIYQTQLAQVINYIEQEDWASLEKFLEYSTQSRPNFVEN
jgi:arogenate dehydrogenase (NADP+)